MPGLLVMNHHSADGVPSRDAQPRAGDALSGRSDKPTINGDVRNGAPPVTANGFRPPEDGQLKDSRPTLDLPPEVRLQIQEELFSFPKMVQRAAQQCFSNLGKLLAEMADMPNGPDPGANGINSRLATNGARREDNLQNNKKVRMLKFTDTQQSIFAKLLIMAQWTPHMDEVRRLVDVDKWLHMREIDYDFFRNSMLELSRQGRYYREPNPDIRTALEVLSTGKAPWMPDVCLQCNLLLDSC
jgi:mediator of RNA polymerase II transcription subunit 14